MSEGAITKETMLSGLRDARLPAEAPGGVWADASAAIFLAILTAILLVLILRTLSRKKLRPHPSATDLQTLSHLPEDARRIALLHILKANVPDRYAALRPELYRPGQALDLATLEAEVSRHV